MSKHYHSSIMFEINRLVSEVQEMDSEEVSSLYGIELNEDGSVFDALNNKTFTTVMSWAGDVVGEEITDTFQHMPYKQRFDDWA